MSKLAGAFPLNWIDQLERSALVAQDSGDIPISAVCIDTLTGGYAVCSNRVEKISSSLAHAECLALSEMQNKLGTRFLTDCILVSTLEPCTMCMGAAAQARVAGVLYFLSDEKGGYFSHHRILVSDKVPMRHMLGTHTCWVRKVVGIEERFLNLLQVFFQSLRE